MEYLQREAELAVGQLRVSDVERAGREPRRQEEAPAELDELAQRRADARSGGDYSEADRLRQEIEAQGWEVRDVAGDSGYRLVPKR
jgi:cysteinyl-tRNA synthetase